MDYFWDIVQIVFADIILSGDNALVIGTVSYTHLTLPTTD